MILNTYNILTMKESESFDSFYLKLIDLLNQLSSNGVEYSYSEIVMKILRSLSDKFDNNKYAIEESNYLDTLKPDELASKIRVFETITYRKI